MIHFHTTDYVPASPGYYVAVKPDVIHVGLSSHVEPWYREFLMTEITKHFIARGIELPKTETGEATIIPFPQAAND